MTQYATYTLVTGSVPVEIDMDAVCAWEPVSLGGGGVGSAVWPIGVFDSPFIIDREPLDFANDLIGLGKTIVTLTQATMEPLFVVLGQGPVAQLITEITPTLCALWGVESSPWIVIGTPGGIAAQLTPPPVPPGVVPFRNTFDRYSSDVTMEAFVWTADADRVISPQEVVSSAALIWSPTTPTQRRTWTMPDLASLDAYITGNNLGKKITDPGSGAKTFSIINKSPFALDVVDAPDFHSPFSVGYSIPPGEQGIVTWGHPRQTYVDGGPIPTVPGWNMTIGDSGARAGTIWAGALVDPSTGNVVPPYVFGGAAAAGGYVPGSGLYAFTFNPPVPAGYQYLVGVSFNNGGQGVIAGNPGGPGVCTVICDGIGAPWADAIPFQWWIILVPPP